MRWFINSTKETAGIKKTIDLQTQIDGIFEGLKAINDNHFEHVNYRNVQINNILKHQGNQDDRIDELTKRVKELENMYMPKQANGNKKPKFRRIANSYADHKFDKVFQIAMGYSATGMKQREIAGRLNSMNIKTATGSEFDQKSVSKLLQNQIQKARFMKGKERKPKL